MRKDYSDRLGRIRISNTTPFFPTVADLAIVLKMRFLKELPVAADYREFIVDSPAFDPCSEGVIQPLYEIEVTEQALLSNQNAIVRDDRIVMLEAKRVVDGNAT